MPIVARVTRCTTVCVGHESVSRCDVTRQRKTRWMVKAGQDSCSVHSLTLEASSYAEPNHSSGPTCGFVASPEMGTGATVGTLLQGYLLLLRQGRTRVVIRNYVIRDGAAGPHGSGSYLTGPTAPDPLPVLGW